MVINALRTGAKTIDELSFHMALDELTLGVAVLSLCERGIVATIGGNGKRSGKWQVAGGK
jgi:hypothetical protein